MIDRIRYVVDIFTYCLSILNNYCKLNIFLSLRAEKSILFGRVKRGRGFSTNWLGSWIGLGWFGWVGVVILMMDHYTLPERC